MPSFRKKVAAAKKLPTVTETILKRRKLKEQRKNAATAKALKVLFLLFLDSVIYCDSQCSLMR